MTNSLLIGPIFYITNKRRYLGKVLVTYVPDYNKPGVKERIAAEVDEIEAMCYDRRKL